MAAAAAGEVTHAVLPEHFASAAASQAIKAGQDLAPIIDLQESWSESTGGDRLPQIAVVATRSLVSEHPHVVEAIQIATANAIERTSDDPAMAAILASKTSLPEPLVTAVLTSLNLTYRSVPEARADLDLMLQSLLDGAPDGLGGQLPADSFFAR